MLIRRRRASKVLTQPGWWTLLRRGNIPNLAPRTSLQQEGLQNLKDTHITQSNKAQQLQAMTKQTRPAKSIPGRRFASLSSLLQGDNSSKSLQLGIVDVRWIFQAIPCCCRRQSRSFSAMCCPTHGDLSAFCALPLCCSPPSFFHSHG